MSSIWNPQDRYLLSNMTSEKLYAKSPLTTGVSGTSAYIGLEPSATYNETVLWSGNLNKVSAYADLSAPLTAFDTVKFYCSDHNGNHSCINEFWGDNWDQLHQSLNESFVTTAGQMCYRLTRFSTNADKTRITISNAAQYNVTGNGIVAYSHVTANNADCYIFVNKIVGINRKEV